VNDDFKPDGIGIAVETQSGTIIEGEF